MRTLTWEFSKRFHLKHILIVLELPMNWKPIPSRTRIYVSPSEHDHACYHTPNVFTHVITHPGLYNTMVLAGEITLFFDRPEILVAKIILRPLDWHRYQCWVGRSPEQRRWLWSARELYKTPIRGAEIEERKCPPRHILMIEDPEIVHSIYVRLFLWCKILKSQHIYISKDKAN